jgi:hypothetical protein
MHARLALARRVARMSSPSGGSGTIGGDEMGKWVLVVLVLVLIAGALLLFGTLAEVLFDVLRVIFWILVATLILGVIVWRVFF